MPDTYRKIPVNQRCVTPQSLVVRHFGPHIYPVAAENGAEKKRVALSKDAKMTEPKLGTSPFLLGFGHLERLAARAAKAGTDGYPPFNIEQTSDNSYRITLAVAGFSETDLSITVEDRQLQVLGRQSDDGAERLYLHRGIAARQFRRTFVLADGVEVAQATTENGLLHIDLERAPPESVVQTIRINNN